MNQDKVFTLKIAFFNSMGYLLTAAGVTFVDAKLVSSPLFGARHYPLGYWICLGAPIVFLLSFLLARQFQSWKRKALWPTLCLLLISAISLPNFRPGFPHTGFLGGISFYCFISLVASWIHYAPLDIEWIADSSIDPLLKLERLKELITFWRTLTVYIAFGWIALLVPWTSFFWSSSKAFLKTPTEIVINSGAWTAAMCGFSIFVFFGPVYESFRKTTRAVDQILRLNMARNSNKEKTANASFSRRRKPATAETRVGADATRRANGAASFHPLAVPALRAGPTSGCSGQPAPRARSRARPPLSRDPVI